MFLTTLQTLPNKTITEHIGLVYGSCVKAASASDDVIAGLKSLVGGEIKKTTKIIMDARHEATERMMEEAKKLNANAILNIRYTASSNVPGTTEIFVYGSAARIAE